MEKTMFSIRAPRDEDTGRYVLFLIRGGGGMFGGGNAMTVFAVDRLIKDADTFSALDTSGETVVLFSKDTPFMLVKRELFEQYSQAENYRREVELHQEMEALARELGQTGEQKLAEGNAVPIETSHPGMYV